MNKIASAQVVFRVPAAIYPVLPLEIIDNVCQRLALRDLAALVRANTTLNAVGTRRLYHTINVDLPPARLLRCMITLDRSADLALLVRTFEVNLIAHMPTRAYYLLLERVLKKMIHLTTLVVELPKRHSPTWVLPVPSPTSPSQIFRLRSLTISMHCKPPLARFLDSQSEVTELTLRGINSDSSNPLYPFITTLFHSVGGVLGADNPFSAAISSKPSQFTLLPTSLPKLSHFNAIHAGPTVIRDVITSRPVTHMSIPLFPPHTMDTLSALSLASKPLARLSVMSFDPTAPHFLFNELSARFPDLEALHVVVLMAEVTAGMLLEWGQFLAGFRRLRYITFMAALGGDEDEEIDERQIAKVWHSSCPTLKTIILPQGKVWFEGSGESEKEDGEGNWKCLNWDDD
ncbi:hypothetical protein P691DRAFT_681381 [Macrolepiota fuliginosa MF-IS2]|uniref:F-box domain-containing protein n=1 Tax=Macrolepiota fuliginosa MF-IS2 TaxID=1400762 RepID=A0A9P5X0H9_9AGAR|nr:hypothetical protein P691DRAFT_681381 [Macrolepiota fuliginosa MF-IS2]